MKIERELILPAIDEQEALARAEARLRRLGYRPEASDGRYLRGSLRGNLVGLDPRGLKTRVTTLTLPVPGGTRLHVVWDIDMTGQILTRDELGFWRDELDGLCAEVRAGRPLAIDHAPARRAWRSAAGLILVSFVAPLLALMVGMLTLGLSPWMAWAFFLWVFLAHVGGLTWLRRDMPPPRSLLVEGSGQGASPDAETLVDAQPQDDVEALAHSEVEALGDADAQARLELEDFDRRLEADARATAPAQDAGPSPVEQDQEQAQALGADAPRGHRQAREQDAPQGQEQAHAVGQTRATVERR